MSKVNEIIKIYTETLKKVINEKVKDIKKIANNFSEEFFKIKKSNIDDSDYCLRLKEERDTLKMVNANLIGENFRLKDEIENYRKTLEEILESLEKIRELEKKINDKSFWK